MTNTGLDWAPDMHCTGWLDGVPTWLGGTGNEWIDCCRAHDLSDQSIAAAADLAACVATTGHAVMGVVMMLGLVLFGQTYMIVRKMLG